jgi:hypoxanthine phosphoribosyltransferase
MNKTYISADGLYRDAFALARLIWNSGYRPDVILVLWRGGTPVGIVIHEYFLYKGLETYHAAVKATSYTGIGTRMKPSIEHLEGVLGDIQPGQKVLLIDDIFDTGHTMDRVKEQLLPKTEDIQIATLYYKPEKNETTLTPDFYIRSTDKWIVFPHELMDLTPEEIQAKNDLLNLGLDL